MRYVLPQYALTENIYTAPRTPKVGVAIYGPDGVKAAGFLIGDSASQQTALRANLLKHLAKSKETKNWTIASWNRVSETLIEVRLTADDEPAEDSATGKYPARPQSTASTVPGRTQTMRTGTVDEVRPSTPIGKRPDLEAMAWPVLLGLLDGPRDANRDKAVFAELERRYEGFTYREVKADIPELSRLYRESRPSSVAARRALEEAFSRAPISDSMRWLADADANLKALIWERLALRIKAADDERWKSYREWSAKVLNEPTEKPAARLASIEFLGQLPNQAGATELIAGLRQPEASIRMACAEKLRKVTGESHGPHPGDDADKINQAIERWETWIAKKSR